MSISGISDGIPSLQIATLLVAALAVIASIVGIFVNYGLTRRSEREIWLRDLRVRLYGECAALAEEIQRLLPSGPDEKVINSIRKIEDKIMQVMTYSPLVVEKAAKQMLDAHVAISVEYTDWDPNEKPESTFRLELLVLRDRAFDSLTSFNLAVRSSLQIGDD